MSTRAIIARATKAGFRGRYHHWDGYPTGLGNTLFAVFNGHFKGDLTAMLRYLIDEHPAGWSTINSGDFTQPPGFGQAGPECYCHGSRAESAQTLTHKTASACGCEWAYVFSLQAARPVMEIYSAYHRDGNKAIGYFGCGDPKAQWRRCATVQLLEPEPDWTAIETGGTETQRPVVNFA